MGADAAVRVRALLPRTPPAQLAVLTVLAQVCYPLVHGDARDRLTVATVVLFAGASVTHAWATRGGRVAARVLVATAVPGFAAEVLGVHSGVPFGSYAYNGSLGIRLFGVPIVVALAWTMFAYPAAVVAQRVASRYAARVAVGAWALASWDLFLDPQLVAAGHWRWRFPSPHLPGVPAVPLTDYAGWLLVATLISLALQVILRPGRFDDRVPIALFVWTWASSVLALAAFLDLAAAALCGGVAMGLVAVPLLRSLATR